MPRKARSPLVVAVCNALIRGAAFLVPEGTRPAWREERSAEVWHRWQFLAHAGEWTILQQWWLFRDAARSVGQPLLSLAADEAIRTHAKRFLRLPQVTVGACCAALLLLYFFTGGLPACRFLVSQVVAGNTADVVLLWIQPFGDLPHGVPADVLPSWKKRNGTVASFARFVSRPATTASMPNHPTPLPAIVTDDEFLSVLRARPMLGQRGGSRTAAIDYELWVKRFRKDQRVLGRVITVGRRQYPITAVLPPDFHFLSRQPTAYVADGSAVGERSMVLARLRPGTSAGTLVRQLQRASADTDYYFFLFHPRIRSARLMSVLLMPIGIFASCVLASALLIAWACGAHPRGIRQAFARGNRAVTLRRAAFFALKVGTGLFLVFATGLEWGRPQASVLLPWSDEGSGPLISWFYVLGTMAVLFLTVADGRARCPVCLRLLAFPVRIGSPGSLFLNWSGTELYCSEGHGILHVPHLFTSWHERKHRWIGLEESWRGLFTEENQR